MTDFNDLNGLILAIERGFQPNFLFFWGHTAVSRDYIGKECLSQWWPAEFTVDAITYPTAEHFMMAEKARLFNDLSSLQYILNAKSPALAKRLGRSVIGFDEDVWDEARPRIVVKANIAKFSQNPALGTFLRHTAPKVIVEASPHDRIWGIGLTQDDPLAADPRQWPGLNLLGFALMEARHELIETEMGGG